MIFKIYLKKFNTNESIRYPIYKHPNEIFKKSNLISMQPIPRIIEPYTPQNFRRNMQDIFIINDANFRESDFYFIYNQKQEQVLCPSMLKNLNLYYFNEKYLSELDESQISENEEEQSDIVDESIKASYPSVNFRKKANLLHGMSMPNLSKPINHSKVLSHSSFQTDFDKVIISEKIKRIG